MPNGSLYGLAGITADQILRLTLANVARSPEASCLVDVSFVDETGMVRSHRRQTISPGLSQILNEPFSPSTTTSARSAPTANDSLAARVLLRPIINLGPIDPIIPLARACGAIKTTLSVNDATTKQPLAIIPQDPVHPMNPLFDDLSQAFPPTPVRYPFLTTTPSDPIHIHVTNAAPQDPVSPPVQVKMGFQTAGGVILQLTVIILMPGKSATLIQTTIPSDPTRPVISVVTGPPRGIVTSVELVDAVSARAILFFPPTPIRGSLAFNPSRMED